jgi:hypothetical protein
MKTETEFWFEEMVIRHSIWRNYVLASYTKFTLFPFITRRTENRLHQQYKVAELRYLRALENAYMR